MGTSTSTPSAEQAASATPARRDWVDVTVRLATSWVGLFTAYVGALIIAIKNFQELTEGLNKMHLPPWVGIALIAAFPVLALAFSTIPAYIEQRRIKQYSQITGKLQVGHFTLRPREKEEGFERADNVHEEILHWVKNSKEPVLYLTGASGTGKSSLLSAWVIPKLRREKHIVLEFRGYEDLLSRLKEELLKPGVIWPQPEGENEDAHSLLLRAGELLNRRRVLIVVDQFEEFLILADQSRQDAFREFVSGKAIDNVTVLLAFRHEYERLIQDQSWPKIRIDGNRNMVPPFTEGAAQSFLEKSNLQVNTDLQRRILREASELDQTAGLIRPVTINMCGLVLSRFSSGLPRRFRGGLIRGFLRESLSLPEVRDVAGKLIPQLITDNITKRPRSIADLAKSTLLAPTVLYACLRRLGERDRAIVRPLDAQQETWEISHDLLVPLLHVLAASRTVSLWRQFRPWVPWSAAAVMGIAAILIPLLTGRDPGAVLTTQGWTLQETIKGRLTLRRKDNVPSESIPFLRKLPSLALDLSGPEVADVSALRELKNLTILDLQDTKVTDISPLRELNNLTILTISGREITDVSALRGLKNLRTLTLVNTKVRELSVGELKNLTALDLSFSPIEEVSGLRELKNLTVLNLGITKIKNVSAALGELKNLTALDLSFSPVTDVSGLRELKNLTVLNLGSTNVTDVSALQELKNLTQLNLSTSRIKDVSILPELKSLTKLFFSYTVITDVSRLGELKNLTMLSLDHTDVTDVSALGELKNLTQLDLDSTNIADVSALQKLKNLTALHLKDTKVTDISPLRELKSLTTLNLHGTKVTDVSPLRELKDLSHLDLGSTKVTNVSALRELKNLSSLDLSNTEVADVSVLQELKNLTMLDLRDTKVTDVSVLRKNVIALTGPRVN